MKKALQLITSLLIVLSFQQINAQERYIDNIFSEVDVNYDVVYGNNVTVFPTLLGQGPTTQDLTMDIYSPVGDTETNRPTVILLHTGSFLPAVLNGQATGGKNDNAIIEQCMEFAKKGYVAIALGYRLGWNPTSDNEDVRRRSLIQAAYRGLQDTRTAVRFLRKSVEEGNPYGVSCQMVVGGLGTGGYVSLAAATLNDYESELLLPKFMDTSMDVDGDGELDAVPYIIPEFMGDVNGTTIGVLPELDIDGDGVADATDVTLCTPNHVGYSSHIDMAFNIGGALPDSSWIDAGEPAIASMHCYLDEFGPYEVGDIIVPTTNEFVVEAHGSLVIQRLSSEYGNNAAFEGLSMQVNDAWYGNGDGAANSALQVQAINEFGNPVVDDEGNPVLTFEGHDVYPGLFPIVAPTGDQLSPDDCNGCGGAWSSCFFPWGQQGSPWDWWNNDTEDPFGYPQLAVNNPLAPEGITADTYACQSTTDNPDMSEEKGLAFASMIQEFICPRIYAALDLGSNMNTCSISDNKIEKSLLNIVDITGRSINANTNQLISFYIYDDGSVEKRYLIK
ncbi:MAG: hypothetical protein CMP49_06445 [Flavobacteriales bacterium]|nr:hypothetical protein [Flavobacteriales bacterium]|tara:strand:+ start:33393 stop:35072 length:1680 start_codon:yes stop_codon:yes gene_type:complete